MSKPDTGELTVDVAGRTVSHVSGAYVKYYRFQQEEDWRRPGGGKVYNPQLYPGDIQELRDAAKKAALAAGMKGS